MKRLSVLVGAFVVMAALPLVGCGGGGTTKTLRAYFPDFTMGSQWTRRVTEGESVRQEIESVTGSETLSGQTAFRLEQRDSMGKKLGASYLGLQTKAFLQFGFDSFDDAGNFESKQVFPTPWGIDLAIVPGGETNQTFVLTDTVEGDVISSKYQIRVRYQGIESVTVPAGTFAAAKMELTTTLTISVNGTPQPPEVSTTTEWRTEALGMVKSVDSEGAVYELQSAAVNGTTVP
jgi:hypothetical protein